MTLQIEADGRSYSFDGSRPVRIGRAVDADVVLAAMSVSRLHAEVRPDGDGWLLVDAGGQLGTFVGGSRVTELRLTGSTVVQCGPEADGSSLTLTVDRPAAVPSPPAPLAPSTPAAPPAPLPAPDPVGGAFAEAVPAGFEPTYILAGPLPGAFPGGAAAPRTGPDLMVEAEGREHRFRHPEHVTIGRLPESSIVITDPVASRAHLRVDAVPGGWGFTNLSREGTFSEGRRVESQTFAEPLTLRLGHPSAGPEVVLVPVLSSAEEQARMARKRRGRRLKVGALGVGALVVVAGLIVGSIAVFGGGGGGDENVVAGLSSQELTSAKGKTVLISYQVTTETGDTGFLSGSGSLISADGLILTNAHVADPNNPALEAIYGPTPASDTFPDPDYLTVSLTNPDDGFATDGAVYRAHLVESDGDADAAVIAIDSDADGNAVDPGTLDLPFYDLGDSDSLQTGDNVTVLGFPGIARSGDVADPTVEQPEVSVTAGDIATFINTDRLGPRSEIDTTARIAPGNSGGSAVDDTGRLIGVPSSTRADSSQPILSGRIRPIAILSDLISKAENEAG